MSELLFGDIVVVENDLIGVVVKSWYKFSGNENVYTYEVYVRNYNSIKEYPESKVARYRVRHKELNDEELDWQNS